MAKNILKKEVHSVLASAFYNSVTNRTLAAYFFLGRTVAWPDNDTPPDASNNYNDEYEARNHIISSRRILNTEYSFATKRTDWSSNTVYDMYDPTYSTANPAPSGATSIVDADMFVLTDEFNIYKCINNNNGAVSTEKPSGTSLSYIKLADGYTWKYMMPLSILSRGRFLSASYMPIQNSVTDSFFSPGLTPILINGGTGYDETNTLIQVIGDGSGAIFEPVVDLVTGEITNINVIDAGENYTIATVVVSTPDGNKPQGTGASIEIDLNFGDLTSSQSDVQLTAIDGQISTLVIENTGSAYTNATITITGDGTGATATPTITDGGITDITINNRGSGYTYATVTVSGDGVDANLRPIVAPVGGHGHNIVEETYADTIAFYLDTTEDINQGFDLINDYRQAGILINPDRFNTGGTRRLFSNDRGSAGWVVTYTNINDSLVPDQIIKRTSDSAEFVVIQHDPANKQILLQNLTTSGVTLDDAFTTTNDVALFDVDTLSQPDIDKFSGTLLYYDNKEPYRENGDQNVILKTFIEF